MDKEIFTVKIQKLLYGGKSLAKIDGFPVFVEGGCPEDIAEIKIVKRNKSYAIGQIVDLKTPSQHRVKPFCPMHNVCGSCGLQNISYEEQLRQKRLIVQETISKIYGENIDVLPVKFPKNNKNYRHKVQYPISQTKVSKRIIAGYYKKNSHEAINIKYCPVQPEILDELTEFIRTAASEFNITGYDEKCHSGLLRHVVYRISRFSGKILVTLVINSDKIDKNLNKFSSKLMSFENVTGVVANFNTAKTNVITGKRSVCVCGDDFIIEKIGDVQYKVSSGSFFQVNPESAEIIFNTAKEMIKANVENPSILDAYSGVSAFGLQMKDFAKEIICVEESKSSTDDAKFNVQLNNAENVTVINDDASRTFEKFVNDGKKFDVVLLDPPRKGCSFESLDYAAKLSSKLIVYVSCNPSTLAKDMRYLSDKGFEPKYVQPADMFCHTPHIESVALLIKE